MKSKAIKWLSAQVQPTTTKAELDVIDFLKKCVRQYKEKEKSSKTEFVPPTLEEVQNYVKLKGYNLDTKKFHAYYTESKWHDGKGQPVKNWKLKLLVWDKPKEYKPKNHTNREYSREQISSLYTDINKLEI